MEDILVKLGTTKRARPITIYCDGEQVKPQYLGSAFWLCPCGETIKLLDIETPVDRMKSTDELEFLIRTQNDELPAISHIEYFDDPRDRLFVGDK